MYRVTTDEKSAAQIEALPVDGLAPFAEVRAALELAPWAGDSLNDEKPDAEVRSRVFDSSGRGLVTYLIVERLRRVDILDVLWL